MRVFDSRKLLFLGAMAIASTLAVYAAPVAVTGVVRDVAFDAQGQSFEIRITASEATKFTYFELPKPRRLVVDFHGVQNGIGFKEKAVGQAGVERVRTSLFTDKDRQATRIVFDLGDGVAYKVVDDGEGHVRVVFPDYKKTEPAEPVSPSPVRLPQEPSTAPLNLTAGPPTLVPIEEPVVVTLPQLIAEPIAVPVERVPEQVLARPEPVPVAELVLPVLQSEPAPQSAPVLQSAVVTPQALFVPTAVVPQTTVVEQVSLAAPPAIVAPTPVLVAVPLPTTSPLVAIGFSQAAAAAAQQPQFTGERITLDLTDMPLNQFMRIIHEVSGLNISIDPNVTGTVTGLQWNEVPWDQVLDMVLKQNQLGPQLQGNVLRIATLATLQAEEDKRKAQREAQEGLTPLVLRNFQISNSKADAVAAALTKFLTARGRITQDPRQNALLIEDVPAQFEKLEQLVKFLDTAAPQVEIEARLLQANKSFSRDLGNQLGFLLNNRTGNILTGAASGDSPFARTPPPRATTGGSGVPLIANYPAAATSTGLAFLLQAGGDILLDEIITAAESKGTAKLLSRPKVTTQNNQQANISRGTQIPVQTNVNNTISVQFIEFSLKLAVTPQITAEGTILLTVDIENSSPDFAKAVNGIPSVSTQHASTKVLIEDGGTALIGGILVDSDSQTIQQTPGLGSIPIIGNLFRNTSTIKSTDELLFFITPRIKPTDTLTGLDVTAPAAPPAR